MTIYLLNFLTLPIYRVIFKKRSWFCAAVSFQLFLLLALKSDTLGIDMATYMPGFKYIGSLSFKAMIGRLRFLRTASLVYPFSFESGYVVFNWIVSKLGLGFHGLVVIYAAFNAISIGVFVYRYSRGPAVSFAIFISFNMFFYYFSAFRQSMALSILLWSVPYIISRKYLKSTVIITIAFLFHRISILWLPLLVVSRFKIQKKVFLRIAILEILFLIFAPVIYSNIVVPVMMLIGMYHLAIDFRYNNYIITVLIIALIVYAFVDFDVFHDKYLNLSCWGLLLLVLIEAVAMCNDAFARGTELYAIFLSILIPGLIRTYSNRNTKWLMTGAVYFIMFGFLIYSLNTNAVSIVPYRMI